MSARLCLRRDRTNGRFRATRDPSRTATIKSIPAVASPQHSPHVPSIDPPSPLLPPKHSVHIQFYPRPSHLPYHPHSFFRGSAGHDGDCAGRSRFSSRRLTWMDRRVGDQSRRWRLLRIAGARGDTDAGEKKRAGRQRSAATGCLRSKGRRHPAAGLIPRDPPVNAGRVAARPHANTLDKRPSAARLPTFRVRRCVLQAMARRETGRGDDQSRP